jgi:periplasmic divalent cation tolerance protein
MIVFYVTCPNHESANEIISKLLNSRLIACGNIMDSNSIYEWNGALCNEVEKVIVIKTDKSLKEQVEQRILEIHPYQVPCILNWEVYANSAYEEWVKKQVQVLD